jgi:hypothetical protein
VPESVVNAKGKTKRIYPWYATPWQILRQLSGVAGYLKREVTIADLDEQAGAQSDTQVAIQMQAAKQKLFASLQRKRSA